MRTLYVRCAISVLLFGENYRPASIVALPATVARDLANLRAFAFVSSSLDSCGGSAPPPPPAEPWTALRRAAVCWALDLEDDCESLALVAWAQCFFASRAMIGYDSAPSDLDPVLLEDLGDRACFDAFARDICAPRGQPLWLSVCPTDYLISRFLALAGISVDPNSRLSPNLFLAGRLLEDGPAFTRLIAPDIRDHLSIDTARDLELALRDAPTRELYPRLGSIAAPWCTERTFYREIRTFAWWAASAERDLRSDSPELMD